MGDGDYTILWYLYGTHSETVIVCDCDGKAFQVHILEFASYIKYITIQVKLLPTLLAIRGREREPATAASSVRSVSLLQPLLQSLRATSQWMTSGSSISRSVGYTCLYI